MGKKLSNPLFVAGISFVLAMGVSVALWAVGIAAFWYIGGLVLKSMGVCS